MHGAEVIFLCKVDTRKVFFVTRNLIVCSEHSNITYDKIESFNQGTGLEKFNFK